MSNDWFLLTSNLVQQIFSAFRDEIKLLVRLEMESKNKTSAIPGKASGRGSVSLAVGRYMRLERKGSVEGWEMDAFNS